MPLTMEMLLSRSVSRIQDVVHDGEEGSAGRLDALGVAPLHRR
jgi:hypothetical protein